MKGLVHCTICAEEIYEGQEGFKLLGRYICEKCEKKIVDSTVEDKSYFLLKEKIRTIWFTC